MLKSEAFNPIFVIKSFGILNNPSGIQSRKFTKALLEINIKPTVCAKEGDLSFAIANSLEMINAREININKINSIIKRILPDALFLPDIERFTFKPFILKAIKKYLIETDKEFDWIHTTSFPCSNHLIGFELKKKLNIPWVAQFYDPWVGNPYREFLFKISKEYDKNLEKIIVDNADVIIHTNEFIIEDWIERYGEKVLNKIYHLPFNYDMEDIAIAENQVKSNRLTKKRNLLHVGNLYLKRNLDDLITALLLLKENTPNLEEKLEIVLVGVVSRLDKTKIKKNKLDNVFILAGITNPSSLRQYYENCDALLVIDAPATRNLFFPSKLMEYFLYKKPIIGITPNNGVTYHLLNKSGHNPNVNGSIASLVDSLRKLIYNYDYLMNFDEDFYQNFKGDVIVDKYLKIIEKHVLV